MKVLKIAAATGALVLAFTTTAMAQEGDAGTSSTSRAGLFVEPGITYETGTTTTSYPVVGDSGGTNKGLGLMGRLGFHVSDVFFIAADARYSKPHFNDGRIDANANAYQVGPVIGLQTPVAGLRVWGEYVAQAQLDPDGTNNFDVKFKNGTGFTVGAGFYVLAVSVNLEYQELKYGTTEVQSLGGFNAGDTDGATLKDKAFIASVTFPLAL